MLYPLSYGGSRVEPSAWRGSIVHYSRAAPTPSLRPVGPVRPARRRQKNR